MNDHPDSSATPGAPAPPTAPAGPPTSGGSPRKRLVLLLTVLVVLVALYPLVVPPIQAWRAEQARLREAAPPRAEPAGPMSLPSSVQPPGAALGPSRPTPAPTTTAGPPRFAELPAAGPDRIRALREETLQTARHVQLDWPGQPAAVGLLALAHERFGHTDEAEQCWQECLKLDPQSAEAHAGLGTIARDRGDDETAERHYREALRLNPRLPELRAALADTLTARGRIEDAAKLLEEDVRQFPQATGSWYRLGQAYLQLEAFDKAAERFETAVRIDPQCTYAYYGLANARRRLGQTEDFARHMRTFKELKEKDLHTQQTRTRRFDDEGEVRRSAAFIHAAAGRLYAEHGDLDQAAAHWQRAAQLDPRETLARTYLVRLYERRQQLTEVLRVLEELRTIEPRNPLHALNVGTIAFRRGDAPAAERAFREALALAPEDAAPPAALAELYLRTGYRLAEARPFAERAVALAPTAANYALLSSACQRAGDLPGALAAIERAVAAAPHDRALQQRRARLQAPRAPADERGTARP